MWRFGTDWQYHKLSLYYQTITTNRTGFAHFSSTACRICGHAAPRAAGLASEMTPWPDFSPAAKKPVDPNHFRPVNSAWGCKMGVTAFLFEIRQIQGFVFGTSKLRDASGASELIDAISGDAPVDNRGADVSGLAGRLMGEVGLNPSNCCVYRAAGGVLDFCADNADRVKTFRAAFRLGLADMAPGLIYTDNIANGDDDTSARNTVRSSMSDAGPMRGVALPLGSPMVRPAPLSGGSPAVVTGWTDAKGHCNITGDFADLPTLAARHYLKKSDNRLANKFVAEDQRAGLKWPTVFKADEKPSDANVFPFGAGKVQRIAVLHADGNGMGKLYAAAVSQLDAKAVRDLSKALTKATMQAVQQAMTNVVKNAVGGVVPARPILLGGDDVTLILRADLVAQFAFDYIAAYQNLATTAVRNAGIKDKSEEENVKEWPTMTTKIGFAVIGPNQPFGHAYRLAEKLASAARDPFKSQIGFFRVSGADIPEDEGSIAAQGLAQGHFTLWRKAYDVESFEKLKELAALLEKDDIGRGGLRRVPEALKFDLSEAKRIYARAIGMIKGRNEQTFKELESALAALGFDGTFTGGTAKEPAWCPLLVAHDLSHIMRGQG